MKIAVVLDRFDPARGGLEALAAQFARWLADSGHEVHGVAASFAPGIEAALLPHRVNVSGSRTARAAAFETEIRRLNADIVHDLGACWYYDVFHPLFGIRAAGNRHDLASYPFPLRLWKRFSPGRRRRCREMARVEAEHCRRSEGIIIAPSRQVEQGFRTVWGVEPRRLRVIYNGVDAARFSANRNSPARAPPTAGSCCRGEEIKWPSTISARTDVAPALSD